MADSSSSTLNRLLEVVWVVVGLGALLLALVREPIADWGAWNLVLGAVLAILVLVGLYVAVTGKGAFIKTKRGGMKPRGRRIPAVVAIIALGLALVLQLASGTLTTGDILSSGIWLGIMASMIGVLVETNAQVAQMDEN